MEEHHMLKLALIAGALAIEAFRFIEAPPAFDRAGHSMGRLVMAASASNSSKPLV
jgi:hypothetical protein